MPEGQQGTYSLRARDAALPGAAFCLFWGSIFFLGLCVLILSVSRALAAEETLKLQDLIREALQNNPEIHVAEARADASDHRIPQATSLADPMFMVGYENEGTRSPYTFNSDVFGMPADSRWMFSLSQMFPYPGKRGLKGEMATRDAEAMKAMVESMKLNTVVRIRELYYDLFYTYTALDLLADRAKLFSRIEDAAVARYSTGMAPQQEVLMAQTEKYMILEREEMERQKIPSLEAMINAAVGRDTRGRLGRPEKPLNGPYGYSLDELITEAYNKYPLIKFKEKMVGSAQAKIEMAKKEYFPDMTLGTTYFRRGDAYPDMWNLTATINIPLYAKTKQREGVLEAEATLLEAKRDVDTAKLMASSSLRDNYSMVKTGENLMALYKDALMPKAYQDFELALAGYVTGKVEAITVITRLKALIDYEFLYWRQFADRQKAVARLDGLAARTDYGADVK
jgi:outer membrane protein, heavy metal efflux system